MKIATWNVNSLRVRLPQVLEWMKSAQPDILAVQETKLQDENFPVEEIENAGYQVIFSGQKTYNGVAIISRAPASGIVMEFPGLDDPQRRILAASYGDIRVLNVYIPNGQTVDSDKFQYKLRWLKALQAYVKEQLSEFSRFVILGDFNIAPEAIDVYDPERWEGKVLCSDQERAEFKQLINAGLVDTFRLFEQPEKLYSWWDYRMASFRRNLGLRIDHILATETLTKACVSCVIDKTPRAWERPSDHTPVMADFNV